MKVTSSIALLQKQLDEYYHRAKALGFSEDAANDILKKHVEYQKASPYLDSFAAVRRAKLDLINYCL